MLDFLHGSVLELLDQLQLFLHFAESVQAVSLLFAERVERLLLRLKLGAAVFLLLFGFLVLLFHHAYADVERLVLVDVFLGACFIDLLSVSGVVLGGASGHQRLIKVTQRHVVELIDQCRRLAVELLRLQHLLLLLLELADDLVSLLVRAEYQILQRDVGRHRIERSTAERALLLHFRVSIDALLTVRVAAREENEWLIIRRQK